jgi:hypothetical protein
VTIALIDDRLLSKVLRGRVPKSLATVELCTTGHWYVGPVDRHETGRR